MRIEVQLSSEIEYYRYLIDTVNLYRKYNSPKRVIRGREIDLLCLMAVGSDRSHTLSGEAFREWLMENGGFTKNDIYRYTSSLVKKEWLIDTTIRITPEGKIKEAKTGDIDALEAYKFQSSFLDKKRAKPSLEMTLSVNVDNRNNQAKEETGSLNGDADAVSAREAGTVLRTV